MLFPDGDQRDMLWGLIFFVVTVILFATVAYGIWYALGWLWS